MKALVTGGGGFLGRHLVINLLEQGWKVVSFGRSPQVELQSMGVEVIQGDLRSRTDVEGSTVGVDVVFHTAAIAGVWGPEQLYEGINVQGTHNVVDACHKEGVKRLIYTSSPSVIFDGNSHVMANESKSYPKRWLCAYQRTKALAEQVVLKANLEGRLSTTSLRPHLIFGPGDPHLIPRLVQKAISGKLKQIGSGKNWVDMVHVQNVVDAHLLAELALRTGRAGGQAYFITNGEPVILWEWIRNFLGNLNIEISQRSVPAHVANGLGFIFESVYRAMGIRNEPPLTRFIARQLASDHTYSIDKARKDIGYVPKISMAKATQELISEWKQQEKLQSLAST